MEPVNAKSISFSRQVQESRKILGEPDALYQETTVFIHSPIKRNKLYPNVSGITRILILFFAHNKNFSKNFSINPMNPMVTPCSLPAYKSKHLYNPILGGEEGMQE